MNNIDNNYQGTTGLGEFNQSQTENNQNCMNSQNNTNNQNSQNCYSTNSQYNNQYNNTNNNMDINMDFIDAIFTILEEIPFIGLIFLPLDFMYSIIKGLIKKFFK